MPPTLKDTADHEQMPMFEPV